MAEISAKLVKELRDITDAGMMECKKALVQCNGDIQKAIDKLREKGLQKADKKSNRVAAEGAIAIKISEDFKSATMLEVNSESDFVAQNDAFKSLVKNILEELHKSDVSDIKDIGLIKIDGVCFEDYLKSQIAKIGENIVVRRFSKVHAKNGFANAYVHSNNKIGVLLSASGSISDEGICALKDIAMHAAAMNPKYLDSDCIPKDILQKEMQIAKEQLKKEGKKDEIIDKILPGKMQRFYQDNTLCAQKFVKNDKISVEKFLQEVCQKNKTDIKLIEYTRFELGEGIQKDNSDFASEVAAQLG